MRAAAAGIGHADFVHMPQERGDLGRRMQRVLDRAPPGPVVIIGTDIPRSRRRTSWQAFRMLGSAQCVFGPATDGGYWLVGVRRRPHVPRPFDGACAGRARTRWPTRWPTSPGSRWASSPTLCDVDDAAALSRFGGFARRTVAAGTDHVTRA